MNLRLIVLTTLAVAALMLPARSVALNMDQFIAICEAGQGDCSEHPLLQAYVGGALDLIAMLDEQTDYLGEVYCQSTRQLFNVTAIIDYMVQHQQAYADRNAMLVVIRYLEEYGGC